MKKIIFITVLMAVLFSTVMVGGFAEESTPQIAYRFLDEYITKKEISAKDKTGGYVTLGIGLSIAAASIPLYIWGDEMTAATSETGAPWDSTTKNIACLSVAGGGLLMSGIGLAIILVPPKDYRAEYEYLYQEEDPVVQEALAASVLYDLAITGKNDRVMGGMLELANPIITCAALMISSSVKNEPWYQDLPTMLPAFAPSIIMGIYEIFFEKSVEERVYEKYLTAKEALLVSGGRIAVLN